jgi:hypothetical protein
MALVLTRMFFIIFFTLVLEKVSLMHMYSNVQKKNIAVSNAY